APAPPGPRTPRSDRVRVPSNCVRARARRRPPPLRRRPRQPPPGSAVPPAPPALFRPLEERAVDVEWIARPEDDRRHAEGLELAHERAQALFVEHAPSRRLSAP